MIQRIQSIHLLVAGLLSGVLTQYTSVWTTASKDVYINDLFSSGITSLLIPVLFYSSALLSIVTIFLFKNRQLQFVMGRLNILTNLILLGVLIYVSLTLPGEASVSEKGIGMFVPVLAILLLFFANRAIKKDEDLVKSVDRLR
ncbi:DUF4293 domain-containing protein [Tenacibaculum geojense]|uniref:DUF4293 domain-containing protein n=1 Tax=Tenacibaculum geojense TaxID=915352 RepID=A0ABW3JVL6_9FLAO